MDYFKRVSIVLALIFTFAYLAMSESVRFTTSKQVIVDDISGGASSSSSGSITGAIYVGSMTSFGTITSTTGLRAGTIAASSAAFTVVGNAGLVVSSSAYLATVGGNVGVGNTAPSSMLDIEAGSVTIKGTGAGLNVVGGVNSRTASNLATTSGNVGIGTLTPSSKLDIEAGSVTIKGADAGLVVQSGSVGIGLMNPIFGLDVAGRVDGNYVARFVNNGVPNPSGVTIRTGGNSNNDAAFQVLTASNTITAFQVTNAGHVSVGGGTGVLSQTLAELKAITPTAAGQIYFCSNCTAPAATIVVSTGTGLAGFATATGGTMQP